MEDKTPNNIEVVEENKVASLEELNTSLKDDAQGIAQKVVETKDPNELKDYIQLFNLNQSKKEALRIMKLNGLSDKVEDQIVEKFEKKADQMSNEDLIKFYQLIQSSLDRSQKSMNKVEEKPMIQINQQKITIEGDNSSYNRESREKILEVLDNIFSQFNQDQLKSEVQSDSIEENVIDATDVEIKEPEEKQGEEESND